jgi:hypothetical protein
MRHTLHAAIFFPICLCSKEQKTMWCQICLTLSFLTNSSEMLLSRNQSDIACTLTVLESDMGHGVSVLSLSCACFNLQ